MEVFAKFVEKRSKIVTAIVVRIHIFNTYEVDQIVFLGSGDTHNLVLMVTVSSLKLDIKIVPALKGQEDEFLMLGKWSRP